jgi:hypothetical protein
MTLSYNNAILSQAINVSGNKVGLGTTNPSGQLHVIGTGLFSQNLLVNNVPVSVSGHLHISNDISNFNSSVSGLLPITNIVAGNNISVASSGTVFTISSTGVSLKLGTIMALN